MALQTKLPMGIENFREIRVRNYYYADKTRLIRDLIENLGKVNLFTRPGRFGKTLNMSMLKYFFETGSDSTLFDGLEIFKETEICEEYMGKFPLISITLKDAGGRTFEAAKSMLCRIIGKEAMRFQFLLQSDRLGEAERRQYQALIDTDLTGTFTMSEDLLSSRFVSGFRRRVQAIWKDWRTFAGHLKKMTLQRLRKDLMNILEKLSVFVTRMFGKRGKRISIMEFCSDFCPVWMHGVSAQMPSQGMDTVTSALRSGRGVSVLSLS